MSLESNSVLRSSGDGQPVALELGGGGGGGASQLTGLSDVSSAVQADGNVIASGGAAYREESITSLVGDHVGYSDLSDQPTGLFAQNGGSDGYSETIAPTYDTSGPSAKGPLFTGAGEDIEWRRDPSNDIALEVRDTTNGNRLLWLDDNGRLHTRRDQEAFADGAGSAAPGTNSLLQVEDGGTVLTSDAASMNFTGSAVSATASGDDVTVDISGGGSPTDILDDGTEVVSDATDLDFAGSHFDVSQNANNSSRADVSLTNDTVTVAGNAVSLGGSTAIAHGDLSSIGSSDHHAKYTDSEARTAVEGTTDVNDLSGANGTSGQVPRTDGTNVGWVTLSASDLSDVSPDSTTDAHHTRYSDSEAVSALQAHDGTNVDADTLDGVEGANYARTDVAETFNDDVTISSGQTLYTGQNIIWPEGNMMFVNADGYRWRSDTTNTIMALQNTGHLGIGTNSPSYAVEVDGDVRSTGEQEAFLGSDRRLKTGITPIGGALDKIAKIGGYGFQWHDEDAVQPHKRGEQDVGVIAQEVAEVCPEAVTEFGGGHSEGYKAVNYDRLVPLLIEAVKDLRSQVQELQ